jgi:hypothetical protein
MKPVSLYDARTRLSRQIDETAAPAVIIVARRVQAKVRLLPPEAKGGSPGRRPRGLFKDEMGAVAHEEVAWSAQDRDALVRPDHELCARAPRPSRDARAR